METRSKDTRKTLRTSLALLFLIVMAVALIWMNQRAEDVASPRVSESLNGLNKRMARSRIARAENASTPDVSPLDMVCDIRIISLNETVDNLTRVFFQDNYFILLRINITFHGSAYDNASADTDVIHPNMWHWVTGQRGKTLLAFPYDFEALSLGTMKHGIHEASVRLEYTQQPPSPEASRICVLRALSDLLQLVSEAYVRAGGPLSDFEDDILCREKYLTAPFFRGTRIPGYSIFELQASSYYECYHGYTNETATALGASDPEVYECDIVLVLFIVTYAVLFLAIFYKLWDIYSHPRDILAIDEPDNGEETARESQDAGSGRPSGNIPENGQEDASAAVADPEAGGKDGQDDDTINILRISLIPPVLILLSLTREAEQKYKRIIHLFYWTCVLLVPLLTYLIAFLIYVSRIEEYQHRSMLLGFRYQTIGVWFLDFFVANIMYVAGAFVFLFFHRRYGMGDSSDEELAYNWESKKKKITCYILVVVFCFFRFSATVLLLLEIVSLIIVGIAVNIKYVFPAWLNVLAGILLSFVNVVRFFDKYQELFNNVYSVGKEVDSKNLPHKIFTQKDRVDNRPQTRYEISVELLRDIIKKKLPLHVHFLNTVMHIVIALVFLAIAAVVVIVIDRTTDVSKIVEYFLTVVSVLAAGVKDSKDSSILSAGNKAKNKAQDDKYLLQEDLRKYAETGQFPPPSATCWTSCCSSACCKR